MKHDFVMSEAMCKVIVESGKLQSFSRDYRISDLLQSFGVIRDNMDIWERRLNELRWEKEQGAKSVACHEPSTRAA